MSFSHWFSLTCLRAGQIGALAEEFVEGKVHFEGRMRDVMAVAAGLLAANPVHSDAGWWGGLQRQMRALRLHTPD
jgi:cyclopropane-fatty-acyl-phospholipid synthase